MREQFNFIQIKGTIFNKNNILSIQKLHEDHRGDHSSYCWGIEITLIVGNRQEERLCFYKEKWDKIYNDLLDDLVGGNWLNLGE